MMLYVSIEALSHRQCSVLCYMHRTCCIFFDQREREAFTSSIAKLVREGNLIIEQIEGDRHSVIDGYDMMIDRYDDNEYTIR